MGVSQMAAMATMAAIAAKTKPSQSTTTAPPESI